MQNNRTDLFSKSSPVSSVHRSHCESLSQHSPLCSWILKIYYLMSVYVVCVHMSMQMHVWVHGCRSHRSPEYLLLLLPSFGDRVCHYIWSSAVLIGWLSLGICPLSSAPRLQICCCIWLFTWALGIWTQVLSCLHRILVSQSYQCGPARAIWESLN